MAIKEILLPLVGEPSSAALRAIDKCIAVAGGLGARIIAIAVEEEIPLRPKVVISADIENAEAIAAERSVSNARGLLKAFGASANRLAVRNEQRLTRLALAEVPWSFVAPARVVDLAMFTVKPHDSRSEEIVERLIFESGRPILICPEENACGLPPHRDCLGSHRAGSACCRRCSAIARASSRRAHHHRHGRKVASAT
jgi:hypothetical protein